MWNTWCGLQIGLPLNVHGPPPEQTVQLEPVAIWIWEVAEQQFDGILWARWEMKKAPPFCCTLITPHCPLRASSWGGGACPLWTSVWLSSLLSEAFSQVSVLETKERGWGSLGAALLRSGSPSSFLLAVQRRTWRGVQAGCACSALEAISQFVSVRWAMLCEVSQWETTTPCTEVQMGQSVVDLCRVPGALLKGLPEQPQVGSFWTSAPQRSDEQKVSEGSKSQHWRGLQICSMETSSSQERLHQSCTFFSLKFFFKLIDFVS